MPSRIASKVDQRYDFGDDALASSDLAAQAYEHGVPMGAVQVIKGWIEDGQPKERAFSSPIWLIPR